MFKVNDESRFIAVDYRFVWFSSEFVASVPHDRGGGVGAGSRRHWHTSAASPRRAPREVVKTPQTAGCRCA